MEWRGRAIMKSKFNKGRQLLSVGDFEQCGSQWYIVYYDGIHPRTRHRSVLISLQYRTLANYISIGKVYEAIEREKGNAKEN